MRIQNAEVHQAGKATEPTKNLRSGNCEKAHEGYVRGAIHPYQDPFRFRSIIFDIYAMNVVIKGGILSELRCIGRYAISCRLPTCFVSFHKSF